MRNDKLYIKPITTELLDKVFKKTHTNQKNKEFVFYTSELGAIEFECKFWLTLNDKHKKAKYILNLFDKLLYIRKVIRFIKLKKHHIEIGYSLMSNETYNLKIYKWVDLENSYINRIKKEYYESYN